MGTTTRYDLPYPEDDDVVMDGAAAIKALAEKTADELYGAAQALEARDRRGRESFASPPTPGQSRTRSVTFPTPFAAVPRVALTTGGDARVDGLPFIAVLTTVHVGGFDMELFPLADPASSGIVTGSTVTVDWIALGNA